MIETFLTIWDHVRDAYQYVAKQEDSEYIGAIVIVAAISIGLAHSG